MEEVPGTPHAGPNEVPVSVTKIPPMPGDRAFPSVETVVTVGGSKERRGDAGFS